MSVNSKIVDGTGTGTAARVTPDHALLVSNTERTVIEVTPEELTRRKLFFDFFRRESDGSRDMNVDGSSEPQDFVLTAESNSVIWIGRIRIIIEGNNFDLTASGDFRRFGAVAASPGLTNGIEMFSLQSGIRSDIFYDPVKNMGDLFYYQTDFCNFINAVDSQADFLSIDIEMPGIIALPLGIDDKIICRINDNLINADFVKFQVLARGTQEVVSR